MSKVTTKILVPKLRFPEFQDAGEWVEKLVEEYFNVGSSKRVLQKDWINSGIPFYRTRELVSLSKNETFGSEIYISEELFLELSKKYGVPAKGDFLVSGVGTLGISYQVKEGDKFYFKDGNVLWFKLEKRLVSDYFKYCFQSQIIQDQILGQASISTVGTYTIQNAKKTKFLLPPINDDEQQKIADCLSSIDELITAHTQKHEALKAHKKGLMQQLFPAEGETVPKLRFPEFQDAGEWGEQKLGEVASFSKGKGISKSDVTADGKQPCIRYGELYTLYNETIENVSSYTNVSTSNLVLSKANDVIIPASGETQEDIATASCVIKGDIALGGDLNIIRSKMNGVFLSYYLNSAKKKSIAQLSQGISVVHLYPSQLKILDINIPDLTEQQIIADCLSSIDDLIIALSKKIEYLQAQKKGLMQQVFPAADEVEE